MATTTTAIETIAQAAGLSVNTVLTTARILRGRDGALWPLGSQGRGGAAHVYPVHLSNMLLALSADTVTGAAEAAIKLREFILYPDEKTARTRPLGEVLTKRINDVASGSLPKAGLEITIDRIGTKIIRVRFEESPDYLGEIGRGRTLNVYTPSDGIPSITGAEIFYGFHVKQPFLDVLAALWNDTKSALSLRTSYLQED